MTPIKIESDGRAIGTKVYAKLATDTWEDITNIVQEVSWKVVPGDLAEVHIKVSPIGETQLIGEMTRPLIPSVDGSTVEVISLSDSREAAYVFAIVGCKDCVDTAVQKLRDNLPSPCGCKETKSVIP